MILINKNYKNIVSIWLLGSIMLIFYDNNWSTRLTNSGLSITEWELFKGIYPLNPNNSWKEYFDLYKNDTSI